MPEVRIRKATVQDYDEVCLLFEQIDRYHVDILPELFQRFDGPARPRDLFEVHIKDDDKAFFVVEVASRIVGFMNLQQDSSPSLPMLKHHEFVLIKNIYIDEAHRGRGLARRLLDEAKEWGRRRGLDSMQLNVYAGNRLAMGFYEKMGFRPIKHVLGLDFQ